MARNKAQKSYIEYEDGRSLAVAGETVGLASMGAAVTGYAAATVAGVAVIDGTVYVAKEIYGRTRSFFDSMKGLETGSTTSTPQSFGDTSIESLPQVQPDVSTQTTGTQPIETSTYTPATGPELPANTFRVDVESTIQAEIEHLENSLERSLRDKTFVEIPIPNAPSAKQAMSLEALKTRIRVDEGAPLYRIGSTGRSQTGEHAQFWSTEHPGTPG